jgi:TolB protein
MHFLRYLSVALVAAALGDGALRSSPPDEPLPDLLVGYTEFRTDLPGGRYVSEATFRAAIVKADGTGQRLLAEELTREKGAWTQFVGWSPDGKAAKVSRYWKSEEVGKWEEANKTFRPPGDGFRHDSYLVDLASGKATKEAPALDKKKNEQIKNLVHGLSVSPDGKRSAFEDPAYRLFLADADGSNAKQVKTGNRFHLMPSWSPDGAWVLVVAGEHYDCHPHVLKADGTGLRKLASRNGYRGVIDYLDVYDFHDGSSDLPTWAPDSKSVFYTAKVGSNVELFRVTLDGKSEQLTEKPAGSMHYHPAASPDGKWLLYGSKRNGVRQLYIMRLSDKKEHRITDLKKGHAAMWAHWQPAANLGGGQPEQPAPDEVAKLIGRLDSEDFRTRQEASVQLEKLGAAVLPALRKARKTDVELEAKRRIEQVIGQIEAGLTQKEARPLVEKKVEQNFIEHLAGGVSFEMVAVPAGTYWMGSPPNEKNRNAHEGPRHPVTVKPFWIGKCEVTWDQYDRWGPAKLAPKRKDPPEKADAVTRPSPTYHDETFGYGREGHPVLGISTHHAMEYCRWLSAKTGKNYRLPTEAEWEWACRAGTETAYFFGDDPSKLGAYAWYEANSKETTHVVAAKKPNPWGLCDMYGNVAEWCIDYYQDDFYARFPVDTATVQPVNRPRPVRYPYVVRGGSWVHGAEKSRSATRLFSDKEWNRRDPGRPQSIWWLVDADFVGFRVVCIAEENDNLFGVQSPITPKSPDYER